MAKCKCGCNQEVPEGRTWVNGGHASKWRREHPEEKTLISPEKIEEIHNAVLGIGKHEGVPEEKTQKMADEFVNKRIKEETTKEQQREKKIHWAYKVITILFVVSGILQYVIFDFFRINKWLLLIVYVVDLLIYAFLMWTIWRLRKKQEIVVFENIEDFIEQVPKWCLDEKAPNRGIIGHILNAGKEYKQIVLVSKNFEPKKLWSEWNGFQFSINNRAYRPPSGSIRGDIFFYNMDKMTPLIDTVEVTSEDAEDSFQLDAVWNQGFAVGHAAAMSKTQGQIQLILILVAVCVGLILILGIYTYGQFGQVHDEIRAVHTIVANTSQMMQQNQVIVHN
jgi:hypothetical protein